MITDEEFEEEVTEEQEALIREIRALIKKKGGEYDAVIYATHRDSIAGVPHTSYELITHSGIKSESCTSDSLSGNISYVLSCGECERWEWMSEEQLAEYRDFLK